MASAAKPAASDDDCIANVPPRPLAPSVVTLSKAARARVTSLYISGPDDGVTLNKTDKGWETAYAPHCAVAASRVEAALDSLMQQTGAPTERRILSGGDFVLKIVVYAGDEKLLKLSLGPSTEHGVLAQLEDGTTQELRHFKRELLPDNPRFWCGSARP